MSHIPEDLKYTKDSEWIRMDDEFNATCGITDHAQEMLTDIVFVELPESGMEVSRGEQVGVVESVKAVSNVYSPFREGSPRLMRTGKFAELFTRSLRRGMIFRIELIPGELDDRGRRSQCRHLESEKYMTNTAAPMKTGRSCTNRSESASSTICSRHSRSAASGGKLYLPPRLGNRGMRHLEELARRTGPGRCSPAPGLSALPSRGGRRARVALEFYTA